MAKRPGDRTARFVRWALAHGRRLWILASVVGLVGAAATVRLYGHLQSDLEALLPREAGSVRAIDELRQRMPGLQSLGVIVDTGNEANLPAAERFLDDLAVRIRAYGPDAVRSVKLGISEEQAFLSRHAPLYLDLDDLVSIRERIQARRSWEARQGMGILLDDEAPPSVDFGDLRTKYERRAGGAAGSADGRYSSAKKHLTLLLAEVGSFSTGADQSRKLLARVKADIEALGGLDHYAPGMRVGFTGEVAVSVEEISALEADLAASSILVILAVVAVLLLYFRWWPSVPALMLPLGVATVATFGLIQLPPFRIRELNSNTAFLGSIVIGNGINFAIILLARYLESRRAGAGVEEAIAQAISGSRRGTLVAAAAAGASYASLLITDFRGFRQFGLIGGVGMMLAWGAAYLLTPALLVWLDRGKRSVRPASRDGASRFMGPLATSILRYAAPITVAAALITVQAGFGLRRLSLDRIESDFSQLRRRDTWQSGEGYWGRKMDDLLGRYLSPTVILADSPAQASAIAARLRDLAARPELGGLISGVRTAEDLLPAHQEEKIEQVDKIRRLLTPAVRASLDPERLAEVDRWLGEGSLAPVQEADLPQSFRAVLRERDGSPSKVVLVYPKLSRTLWQAEVMFRYTDLLRQVAESVPAARPARVAGALPLSTDLVRSIRHDGPIASAVALAAVIAIVLIMFRGRGEGLAVLGSLVVGVLWMTAATVGAGIKINFGNFIAFPITFGIGVDYAVNVMTRYMHQGRRDLIGAIRSTGGAVGLCSMTTIIGYSSLLLAKNQALFLFGVVAVIGEVTCLVAAVVALPAVLKVTGDALARRRGLVPPRTAVREESANPRETLEDSHDVPSTP